MTGPVLRVQDLSVSYGEKRAVNEVTLDFPTREISALIGPSGCGKSTLLRALNRLHDLDRAAHVRGRVELDGVDVLDEDFDPVELRRRVGMVFQEPNPFPKSIFDNVAYGLRLEGVKKRRDLAPKVEAALRQAALWEEVHDRLKAPALGLSGGQQQRLCIARALAVEPEVLLLDEPTSALDPISTSKVEDLIRELTSRLTVVIVTHNMQQARRLADRVAVMYLGDLIEAGTTEAVFEHPQDERAKNYVGGAFG